MSDLKSREEIPLLWKIVAGLLVLGFALGVWQFVEWRSAPPPPPALPTPLP
jgi:hypothetical protein